MGRRVNDVMLYLVTRKTPQSLVARIKRLGHRTQYGIQEGEDMYDYMRRIKSGETTGDEHSPSSAGSAPESSSPTNADSVSNAPEIQDSIFEESDRMQEYLNKAKEYLKGDRWWNTNKKQYAIFLKVLFCRVFNKTWSNNVRWVQLPIYPLRDGTQLTITQLKGALRGYDETIDGGTRKSFEKIFDNR